MNGIFVQKTDATPLAIFDSTAEEDDFGVTLADTPDEADVDGDESDPPIRDWEVTPRTAAASHNEDGGRAITPDDGEEGIVVFNARITAEDTRTWPSPSPNTPITTASASGTHKRDRYSGTKLLRATRACTTSTASQ
ncbi:hypothetical protein PsorP6_010825 [Peronosclerospora sorghi]|uniref:Uncharacterized protein n=1 Tax=Peronosclerospora sorghi TaxID=230839 RepID=A0ACC0VTH0_9STRA|nr:hypothetical protein PsorP6_010825 [Peronosclerospora sorghi]